MPTLLLVSQDRTLESVFRGLPAALGRPVAVARVPALTHPSLRKPKRPWHAVCLDVRVVQETPLEGLYPLFRHLWQVAPALKWVALGEEAALRALGFPGWLRFHRVVPPPWTAQSLARALKPLLFPPADVQAALTDALPLPARPEWLGHPKVLEMLESIMDQVEAMQGLGWWDEEHGVLLWRGEPLPQEMAFPKTSGATAAAERLAWWRGEGAVFWVYALPVFRATWLTSWGKSPLPWEEVRSRMHSLRDALHHMEPPLPPEMEEGEPEPPEFPEEPKPLFQDVPPPFPFPYPF